MTLLSHDVKIRKRTVVTGDGRLPSASKSISASGSSTTTSTITTSGSSTSATAKTTEGEHVSYPLSVPLKAPLSSVPPAATATASLRSKTTNPRARPHRLSQLVVLSTFVLALLLMLYLRVKEVIRITNGGSGNSEASGFLPVDHARRRTQRQYQEGEKLPEPSSSQESSSSNLLNELERDHKVLGECLTRQILSQLPLQHPDMLLDIATIEDRAPAITAASSLSTSIVREELSTIFPQSRIHKLFSRVGEVSSLLAGETTTTTAEVSVKQQEDDGSGDQTDSENKGILVDTFVKRMKSEEEKYFRLFSLVVHLDHGPSCDAATTGGDAGDSVTTSCDKTAVLMWGKFAPYMMPRSLYVISCHDGDDKQKEDRSTASCSTLYQMISNKHSDVRLETVVMSQNDAAATTIPATKLLLVYPSASAFRNRIDRSNGFPTFCSSTLPGLRYMQFYNRLRVKKWLPQVQPLIRIPKTYRLSSDSSQLTDKFLERLPDTYMLKSTTSDFRQSTTLLVENKGTRFTCLGSTATGLCDPRKQGETGLDYIRRICEGFLTTKTPNSILMNNLKRGCMFEEAIMPTRRVRDIRIHMFHGKPKFISVDSYNDDEDDGSSSRKISIPVTVDWKFFPQAEQKQEWMNHGVNQTLLLLGDKPSCWDDMLRDATTLFNAVNDTLVNSLFSGGGAEGGGIFSGGVGAGAGAGGGMNFGGAFGGTDGAAGGLSAAFGGGGGAGTFNAQGFGSGGFGTSPAGGNLNLEGLRNFGTGTGGGGNLNLEGLGNFGGARLGGGNLDLEGLRNFGGASPGGGNLNLEGLALGHRRLARVGSGFGPASGFEVGESKKSALGLGGFGAKGDGDG